MNIFQDQALFMRATGQAPDPILYFELFREESDELRLAWDNDDKIEIADGIIDTLYVLAGLANSLYGPVKAKRLWDEVQASNMSKVQAVEDKDGRVDYVVLRRDDGKILKPESYFKPDLAGVLND
jgi:predicted HAD superfamily Cof-like phosphohydrolase